MPSFSETLAAHAAAVERLAALEPRVLALVGDAVAALQAGGKLLIFGNGGSAADAQHIAAELTGRYERERPGLAAVALTTDTSALTAIANDYGFDRIFARQVEALARPEDVLIGISTSGNSPNVVAGLRTGIDLGCTAWGLAGRDGGAMNELCGERIIVVPERSTARIQECHILIGHIVCDLVEEAMTL